MSNSMSEDVSGSVYEVAEESQSGDVIRDQVIRIAEINQCTEYSLAFFITKLPFLVAYHVDDMFQLRQAFAYEAGQFSRLGVRDQLSRRGFDGRSVLGILK